MYTLTDILIYVLCAINLTFIGTLGLVELLEKLVEQQRQKPHKELIAFIRTCLKFALHELKVNERIKVHFKTYHNECSFGLSSGFTFGISNLIRSVSIDSLLSNEFCMIPQGKEHERLYYTVAHEVAHAFQYYNHRKWFEQFKVEYFHYQKKAKTNKEYMKAKLERNANKIAGILLKRYKKYKFNKSYEIR